MGRQCLPSHFLAHIDALSLLKRLADEVIVPFSVHKEVLAGAGQGPGFTAFELPDWVSLREDLPLLPEIAGWDLVPAIPRLGSRCTTYSFTNVVPGQLIRQRLPPEVSSSSRNSTARPHRTKPAQPKWGSSTFRHLPFPGKRTELCGDALNQMEWRTVDLLRTDSVQFADPEFP